MQDGYDPKRIDVERSYRSLAAPDLLSFRVAVGETDLFVMAAEDCREEIITLVKSGRRQLKEYIASHPEFIASLEPLPNDTEAPGLVHAMLSASIKVRVGPMAAVAGAVAAHIGYTIRNQQMELIIENGGDIFLRSVRERIISIFAGESPFSGRIAVKIAPQPQGIGICTSAGTVGPSLSFGTADAVTILAPDPALADAAATAAGNRIHATADLQPALEFLRNIPGICGAVLVKGDRIAAWGEFEIVPIQPDNRG